MSETAFHRAIRDPAEVFDAPEQVEADGALTLDQKRQILERWAFDLRSLEVAEAENMPAPRRGNHVSADMQRVLDALARLARSAP